MLTIIVLLSDKFVPFCEALFTSMDNMTCKLVECHTGQRRAKEGYCSMHYEVRGSIGKQTLHRIDDNGISYELHRDDPFTKLCGIPEILEELDDNARQINNLSKRLKKKLGPI